MNPTATKFGLNGIMADTIATGGRYDPAVVEVGLFTAITDKGPLTLMTDVTEAAGTDYARVPITAWSAVYNLTNSAPVVDGPICAFTLASGQPAQTCIGYFLSDSSVLGAGDLLMYEYFDAPLTLLAGAPISVVPRLSIPIQGPYLVSQWWDG